MDEICIFMGKIFRPKFDYLLKRETSLKGKRLKRGWERKHYIICKVFRDYWY